MKHGCLLQLRDDCYMGAVMSGIATGCQLAGAWLNPQHTLKHAGNAYLGQCTCLQPGSVLVSKGELAL